MMYNRYGVAYAFEPVNANTYKLVGNFNEYTRYGSRGMESGVDLNDLGFIDPAGGPFIGLGGLVEGREVVNISSTPEGIFIKVYPKVEKEVVNG